MKYKVELLQPAVDFISSLPVKTRAKVFRTIGLLESFGYQLSEPHSKTLKGHEGLKELRIKLASNIFRLFYFYYRKKVYIITSGYQKKDKKTDQKEIDRALRLMHEYTKGK